jgi:hypothetical protein
VWEKQDRRLDIAIIVRYDSEMSTPERKVNLHSCYSDWSAAEQEAARLNSARRANSSLYYFVTSVLDRRMEFAIRKDDDDA